MFEFTESITIRAPRKKVWEVLSSIEAWWPPSNPEHISIEVRPVGESVEVGTSIAFAEKVAGIRADAEGSITDWSPERQAAWKGVATYRYYGIPIRIREGVSWQIKVSGGKSILSATVWAEFPQNLFGRFFEWYAKRILNVVERDKEHARRELEYLKRTIEG